MDIKVIWRVHFEWNYTEKKETKCAYKWFVSANRVITDGKYIANCFNDFKKKNIGPSLAKKIQTCQSSDNTQFLENSIANSMYINPVSDDEIVKVVSKFKNKQSCGYDDINMLVVVRVISGIAKSVSFICSKSFDSEIFPNDMKIAKVIPLFMTGNRKECSNYKPVSILPQFSKILERLLYNRLISFDKSNNIIYNSQYGFRENHSTSLALFGIICRNYYKYS